jgi:hypothetical protein
MSHLHCAQAQVSPETRIMLATRDCFGPGHEDGVVTKGPRNDICRKDEKGLRFSSKRSPFFSLHPLAAL